MYSYTASIFWYLSWPLLILVSYLAVRWTLRKFEPVLNTPETDEAAENPPETRENKEENSKEQ